MESVEVIENLVVSDDDDFDVPDNIIHVIYPETLNEKDFENVEISSVRKSKYNPLIDSTLNLQSLQESDTTEITSSCDYVEPCILGNNTTKCALTSHENIISTTRNQLEVKPGIIKSIQNKPAPLNQFTNDHNCCDSDLKPLNGTDSEHNLIKPFNEPQTFVDANHQTDIPFSEDTEWLNLFFCTFHPNGDAETYCNLPMMKKETLTIEEVKEFRKMHPLKTQKVSLEHSMRQRQKAEVMVKEELPVEEATNEDEKKPSPNKGYPFRTQRLSEKFSDMLYSLPPNRRRKNGEREKTLKCCHCTQEFNTFFRLEKHTNSVHGSRTFSFPCHLCGATFTRPHNLKRHKETRHHEGEKRFLCELCGRCFNRQDVLASHVNLVHSKALLKTSKRVEAKKQQTFCCPSCGKYFSHLRNFSNHQKRDLSCSSCLQSFPCKTILLKHMYKQHSAMCTICNKICDNKQQLYFHKHSHAPKFSCKYCNKRFVFQAQFAVHVATHTGVKPFHCEMCGKAFAHRNAVNKHRWQEHSEANKRFPCQFCPKSFVYKAKLESHLRSHTGEKPFACRLCPSSFSHNCNLSAHLKSIHGIYSQLARKDVSQQPKKKVKKELTTGSAVQKPPLVAGAEVQPSISFLSTTGALTQQPPVSVIQLQTVSRPPKTKPTPIAPRLGPTPGPTDPLTGGGAMYHILYAYPNPD